MDVLLLDNGISIAFNGVVTSFSNGTVMLQDYLVDFPGEYEHGGVSVETKEFGEVLVHLAHIDGNAVAYLSTEVLPEGSGDFLRDIDILILPGTRKAREVTDKLEVRLLIPYGEDVTDFVRAFSQEKQAVKKYKIKDSDLYGENTEVVFLTRD